MVLKDNNVAARVRVGTRGNVFIPSEEIANLPEVQEMQHKARNIVKKVSGDKEPQVTKVYIVCRSWVNGYEDHGWDIMGTFKIRESAEANMAVQVSERKEDPDGWWVDELLVLD